MQITWQNVLAHAESAAVIFFLLYVIALLVWSAMTRKQPIKDQSSLVWWWMALCILFVVLVVLFTINNEGTRYLWVLSALPSFMLASHGAFLFYVRAHVVPRATDRKARERFDKVAGEIAKSSVDASLDYSEVIRAGERYFGAQALILRYAVPAILMLSICITVSSMILRFELHHFGMKGFPTPSASSVPFLPAQAMHGAAYGLVGAYAYVLLYLGKRSFRMDITPGAAMWCTVTMAIGPVLAGMIASLWLDPSPTRLLGPNGLSDSLGRIGVLFLAGFSPRFVVESLEESGRRLLTSSSHASLPSRTLPVSQVRGMSRASAERLEEEGIDDVALLAMADPYRLLRNTSFDKRQILSWIDNALLMSHFPEAFSAFERRGILGASSLTEFMKSESALKALASGVKIDVDILRASVHQLLGARQVVLLKVLDAMDEDGSMPHEHEAEPPVLSK